MNSNNSKLASYFNKYDYLERLVKTYKPYSSLEIKNSKKRQECIKDVKSNSIRYNKYKKIFYKYNVAKYYGEELDKLETFYSCTKYNFCVDELKNYKMNTSLFKVLLNHDNEILKLGYNDERKSKQYIRDEFDFFKIITLKPYNKESDREIIYRIKEYSQRSDLEYLYKDDYLEKTRMHYYYSPIDSSPINYYLARNNFHIPSLSYLICLIYLSILLKKDIKEIINFDEIKDLYYVFIYEKENDIEIKYTCSIYRMIDNIYKEFVFCFNEPNHLYSEIDNYFYIIRDFLTSYNYSNCCSNIEHYKEKIIKMHKKTEKIVEFYKYLGNELVKTNELEKINDSLDKIF